jgi:hypothetical protein
MVQMTRKATITPWNWGARVSPIFVEDTPTVIFADVFSLGFYGIEALPFMIEHRRGATPD